MLHWWYGEGLIAHELAHQWWGDMVTCKDFHHIWLNEGFATWSEAYWREQSEGMAAYHDEMEAAAYRGPGTIYVENPSDFSTIFDGNLSYNKASWVVHMLRGALGDEDFFAALALYRERFEYGAADTEDLQVVMEEISGRDLGAFFQQWIYGEYYPRYRFAYDLQPEGADTRAYLRIEQIQTNTGLFTMPIRVRFYTTEGVHEVTVENSEPVQHYFVTVPGTAVNAFLDPDQWILRDVLPGTITGAPTATATLALTAYPNPFNPRTSVRFELPAAGPARLSIYDAAGRLIRRLVDTDLEAGPHERVWDGLDRHGRGVSAGVYMAVLEASEARRTTRLTLIR
jgi:hypothetical protein